MNSKVGKLLLAADANGMKLVQFENTRYPQQMTDAWLEDAQHPVLKEARSQLEAYFDGERRHFDLPLSLQGTAFQNRVWQALQEIPYGDTLSYTELANAIGSPKAIRAVGAANGRNRIPIIIPCHRVIGSNGRLTGFAGGLETKALLLSLECSRRKDEATAPRAY